MRQKADKLEKGKWYCDHEHSPTDEVGFLRFSHKTHSTEFYDENIGEQYLRNDFSLIPFGIGTDWYLPTPEDIEKYNLNETE